jgi:hypothetical protein
MFWPGTDQDMGIPGASEAVSGCNILILPLDASFLRAFCGGLPRVENGRNGHVFGVKLETGPGAFGASRRRRDAGQPQNPYSGGPVIKHGLIPASRLAIEAVPKVQTDRRMTRHEKWQR